MSKKTSDPAMKSRKSMGFSMAPSNSQIPLAYALDIWDIINKKDVTGGVVLSEMLKLLGGSWQEVEEPTGNPSELGYYEQGDGVYVLSSDTSVDEEKTYYTLPTDIIGQYTISELNEKFAEAINNINASVDAINEQGSYRSNYGQPFASEAALLAYSGTKNHNDYAIVKDTSTSDSIKYAFYKYDATYNNGSGRWYKEYEWLGISLTSDQKNAINSGITDSKVQKLDGLPTSSELTEALGAKQDNLSFDETPTENSNNPVTSNGVYAATSANAAAAAANAAEITGIKGKMSSQASTTNKLITEDEVNDKIEAQAANFHGTLETEDNLPTDAKLNDYAFVIIAPNYTAVSSPKGNPSLKNYFERSGAGTTQSPYVYSPTTDTTVDDNKTYYIGEGNPEYRRYKVAKTTDASKVLTLVGIEVDDVIYYRDTEHDSESGSSTLAPYCWSDLSGNKVYTKELSMIPRTGSSGTDYDTVYDGSSTSAEIAGYVDKMVGWTYEYTLNNSSFTAPQWAAINSGITPTQADYVQGLIEKDLYAKADGKFNVTTEIVSGGTYSVDTAASQTMVVKATVTYDGDNVDCINVAANSDAPAGWTRTGKGVYTKSATSTGGSAASVAAQEFKYKPGGVYGDHECKKSSTAMSMTIIIPFYYGWSTQTSSANTTTAVAELTRVNANTGSGTFTTQVPNDGTDRRFWIVAKKTASAKTSGTSIMPSAGPTANVSFTSPQSNSVTLSGYNVYISEQPYSYDALKAIDIVWSVPAAN